MSAIATLFGPDARVASEDLQVARFEPYTTVAWPGRVAAAVVLQGCPLRCAYCHACAFQEPRVPGKIGWSAVRGHLARVVDDVAGVVFTGGEPTRQAALVPALQEVRSLGLAVALESAGTHPRLLREALGLVDFLALDIKAGVDDYGPITGKPGAGPKAWASLDAAVEWGGPVEVRVTVDPVHHTTADVHALVDHIVARGAPAPVLQEVHLGGTTADYAKALAGRTIDDVLGPADHTALAARGVRVRRAAAPRA